MTTIRSAGRIPRLTTAAAIAAVVLVHAGCASAGGTRFVRKEAGFINVGGPPQGEDPVISPEAFERARREALAERASKPVTSVRTIESLDAELREALAALERRPSAAGHLRVAREYSRLGVGDQAYDHYTAALELAPRLAMALDGRARLLRDAGLLGLALADAHRARYHAPDSAEIRNTLGTIFERQGLCSAALAQYREAVRLQPDAAWAQQNAARLSGPCS